MVKHSKTIAIGTAVLVALMLLVAYVVTPRSSNEDTSTLTIEQCIKMMNAQHPEATGDVLLDTCDEVTK